MISPDSFTKAFTRFHGTTPSKVRKEKTTLKSLAPLKIKFHLEGGNLMDYRIEKKAAFTVLGVSKMFDYENPHQQIPVFWSEFYQAGKGQYVKGCFGINIDEDINDNLFEYMIADLHDTQKEIPEGFITKTIPEMTWAIFPCVGSCPQQLQELNKRIFNEWLPTCRDYQIAAGYFIEVYEDPRQYAKGTMDENYYCEAWIPIIKK